MAEDNPLRGKGHSSKAAYNPVQPGPAGTAPRRGCWSSLQEKFPILTKRPFQILLLLLCILPFGLLGLLALRNRSHSDATCTSGDCSSGNKNAIKDDAYFYGQSQPYYPSPNLAAAVVPTWVDSVGKAVVLVRNMTREEKVSLTTGAPSGTGCSGSIPPISRLEFPGLCLSDAGNGLRATDFVSGWPSGIHVGASWNKILARQRAVNMGMEFRTKGVNVALGPVVGPIGRVIQGGRNWEGFAADPWLSGAFAFETVQGIQSVGVITSTKHFIGNEQETNRVPANGKEAVSSNIDDKTMHEVYLWPFQDAVRAGSGNIMCSYNRVNNSYGCQNSYTQNYLLKEELGFQGFVVSDWGAQHSGVASALAGMDMVMPNSGLWGNTLVEAVRNGSVPQVRLDDMAVRIIASWYQMKQDQDFPEPGFGMPPDLTKPHRIVDARNTSSKQILFDGAVEGHVLVKNSNGALPFHKPRMLSLYGYSARNPDQWNYNATGGVSAWSFGGESAYQGRDVAGAFALESQDQLPQIAPNGSIISGGGSGAVTPAYISSPFDAFNAHAYEDGTALFWDFTNAEPYVDSASDACIVMLNAFSSEGYDRPGIRDKYSDGLIRHVAQSCNNTIVVLHNAGTRLVENFIDHPNVTAVIFAHLPGQDSGHALVSILYGESNPSGKLPYTVAANESDYSNLLKPDLPEGMFEIFPQSNFTEGVYIDYRHFDAKNITPRFEFGFGLSYTSFNYSNLKVARNTSSSTESYPSGPVEEGGPSDLWHTVATISADIHNTGEVDGAEAAQLYVGIPGAPIRQLRGFEKPFIIATQSANVSFKLSRRDLSVWDVVSQKWLLQKGRYRIWVGASSRKLPLHGSFDL
ncbi:beta-glucosidase [Apiospora aurea]|uniref:beta-glucosidase n=1 Tax=Apiospora aurea TaxID=335848 RepID=A0ABR1QEI4_9PEZI